MKKCLLGLFALFLLNALFSTKIWTQDADTLIAALPKATQLAIRESEKQKNFASESYQQAMKVYYKAHVRRGENSPLLQDSLNRFFGEKVYTFMWGPSEFTATGNLLTYNRLKELALIKVPTLLTAGEFDEARPASVRYYTSLIPGAKFEVIPDAAHVTMGDNPKENNRVVREFLSKLMR